MYNFTVNSDPESTKHLYYICTTCANIVQMLYKCFAFTGSGGIFSDYYNLV